ncbi:MAG: hypothetical protein Q9191_000402 [Dirinaria sp. TL-2023a]
MLHELLLALSGHPSPLLDKSLEKHGPLQAHLSPAESTLLQSLAQDLGKKHVEIRQNAAEIGEKHSSIVCRAVATAITWTHLAKFQQAILDVEKDILEENPSIVGAYKIVPLSGVVGAFDGWSRKLQWLLDLVNFIKSTEGSKQGADTVSCTAAHLMKWLRDSTHTGYEDIEQLSYQLIGVAEMAWLRQVSVWVLYGKLPTPAAQDFFVHRKAALGGQSTVGDEYEIKHDLVPSFVTPSTADSVLFIGKSLNHIRDRASAVDYGWSKSQSPELVLLKDHLAQLSSLQPPISATNFSAAISAIRLSLSKNALQKLLPISKVLEILRILRGFFLLERGEFAIALITAADQRLASRQSHLASQMDHRSLDGLKGVIIKEGEVAAVLAQTWGAMVALQGVDDEDMDEDLEMARDCIRLSISSFSPTLSSETATAQDATTATFNDLLLSTPTALSLRIISPLDLFLNSSDVDNYSRIHSYLLSIRRAHTRLSRTFLLSALRRHHPSPKAPALGGPHEEAVSLERIRQRSNQRTQKLRPIWATISSAALFVAELGEYFQGATIKSSWEDFQAWLDPQSQDSGSRPGTSSSLNSGSGSVNPRTPTSSRRSVHPRSEPLHDPESLAQAHRTYLSSLTQSLLLLDQGFTSELRSFMTSVDHISALMNRLDSTIQNLDLEMDTGVVDHLSNHAAEEKDIMVQLTASSRKVAEGVARLLEALKRIDSQKFEGDVENLSLRDEGEDVFVPRASSGGGGGGGVDLLLLKLDWGKA